MSAERRANDGTVVIGVLGGGPEPRAAILAAIAAAGATAEVLTDANAISQACAVSALLFDAGDAPERLVPAATALANDPRTRLLPRVLVVDGTVAAARLAAFGAAVIAPLDATSAGGPLDEAIAGALESSRERNELLRTAQTARADARALEKTLAAVQQEVATLSHDARVLFGIILGFASNLRDGFAGPVTEVQHRQLVNIVEASTDATSLIDRHVAALRRLAPPSPETTESSLPKTATRRHVDLADLVRGTVALFQGIAAAKRIRLTADASRTAFAWCDAMLIKQALVNVVSNALKFTPAGGTVEVTVRPSPPPARAGATDRNEVEIVVSDTGPGIPAQDRERVLDRGVRLDRDMAIPGTGIGLAIVRDIVRLHGGQVHIDERSGGGASIAMVFPADRRSLSGELPRANVSPAPPRVRSTSVPPSSSRRTELRREPE